MNVNTAPLTTTSGPSTTGPSASGPSASGPFTSEISGSNPIRKLWVNWLVIWVEIVGLFGAVMILSRAFTEQFFNVVMFGSTDNPESFSPDSLDYLRLTFVVMAAVMIGWAALMWFVVRVPLRAGERWAWTALTISIVGWFVLDSTFSIVSGFPENAVLNSVFVAGAIPPLIATRPSPR
jgi:hypothetical protein